MTPALRLFAVALGLALCACSEDGATPKCPDLPLYDSRDGSIDPVIQQAYAEAAERGCVTAAGDASSIKGEGGVTD